MNSEIKLIALDLDDTTLRSDSTLAPETEAAIKAAIDAGIEVVVASGRAYSSLPGAVLGIPGIRYAISSNGAAIEKVPSGERIVNFCLKPEAVESIIEIFDGEMFEAFIAGQPYTDKKYMDAPLRFGCSPAYVDYVKTTRKPVEDMLYFMRENNEKLDSIDVICQHPENKAALYERAKSIPGVYATSSTKRLIELADENAGKGASLRRLCEILEIQAQNVAAFGNGDNDADMLSFARLGVAVKNAWPACLAAADYVCESNDDLGVAKTVYKILNDEI